MGQRKIVDELADLRADNRRLEDKLDKIAALLAQEVVETPTKKLKSRRPIESSPESAHRAHVGRSAAARNWTFEAWRERFGMKTYKMLNASEQSEADARRHSPS